MAVKKIIMDAPAERKIRTHLDLLSIPQPGGKMSKRLGGIIDCKDKPLRGIQTGAPTVVVVIVVSHIQRIGCQPEIALLGQQ